jgi:hypothetical protein
MATVAYSYDNKAVKEDLLEIITNLTPRETQLVAGLGVTTATSTLHEWLVDTLNTVKYNAAVEGADACYPTITNPTRLNNVTQISRQAFQVTGTDRAVNAAGFADRKSYEAEKALDMLKNDMEFHLMNGAFNGSVVSTNAVRSLRGVKASLSLVSAGTSSVTMTETVFNDLLAAVWTQGREEVDEVYGGMSAKRRVTGFVAGSTKVTKSDDRRLVNAVDVYEADAAKMVKLFAHRYMDMQLSGTSIVTNSYINMVGIKNDKFKIAYLRKPEMYDLAKTGDADKAEVLSEYTLECLNPLAGFVAQGYL